MLYTFLGFYSHLINSYKVINLFTENERVQKYIIEPILAYDYIDI